MNIYVTTLGLNKVSISPIKVYNNALIYLNDIYGIVPIDTSLKSKYSDYFHTAPYQKISSSLSNWRFYFRTVTNKLQKIKLNKTYLKSGEFSIWSMVNSKKIQRIQRIEVLPSKFLQ